MRVLLVGIRFGGGALRMVIAEPVGEGDGVVVALAVDQSGVTIENPYQASPDPSGFPSRSK